MNIILTGASRGIGYEVVKVLAAQQGNRIIAISRSEQNLIQLKAECETMGLSGEIIPFVCDLTNFNSHADEYEKILNEDIKHVDILINNAGALVNKRIHELSHEDIELMVETNFIAAIEITKQTIPFMGGKRSGHVVNIGSMGGFQGSSKFSGLSVYSASKAALAVLTECLAVEFADQGISFNCLALGAVQTDMLAEAFPGYEAPLLAGKMARFIADFALTGHQYFNGKILPVSLTTP